MLDDHQIPRFACHQCGYMMDCTTHAFGNDKPKKGDYSLCLSCGTIGIFNADLSVREPTYDEALKIQQNPQVIEAQLARAYMVGDRIKNRSGGTMDSTGLGQP